MHPRSHGRFRWTLASALILGLASFPSIGDAAPKSVHPALSRIEPGADLSERFLSRGRNGEVFVELILEGDVPPGLLRARGIEINTVAGRWMTACPSPATMSCPTLRSASAASRPVS